MPSADPAPPTGVPVEAVTFDFWETLVHETPANLAAGRAMRLRALGEVLARAGRPRAAGAIEEAYERCGAQIQERFWKDHRDVAIHAQVRLFFDCLEPGLGDGLSPAELEAAVDGYANPVLTLPPVLNPGADRAVWRLARAGVRLGIVSNTGRTPGAVLRRVLERYDLLRHFQVISYSDEVGIRKPAPEIFAATLGRLGVAAARAVHVGDNPNDDVLGARRSGMRAAHYVAGGRPAATEADFIVDHLGDLPERLLAPARRAAPAR